MSVINTNITSMIGQQNLNKSQNDLQTSMERLSSGLRINSAKDDAAGQAIANRMSSQITGLAQAQRNANDGISVAQTAEGGLNQVNDNLQRIRELAVQAENGTNSSDDLNSIQNEINQRLEEIDRISRETDFNGTKVLGANEGASDPTSRTISIQVGAQDGQAIDVNLKQINRETLGLEGFNVTGAGEVANAEATADDLTLNGFTAGATNANGSVTYSKDTDNATATSDALFSALADGDTVTYAGTDTGLGAAAAGDYTFDAESGNFSFDVDDAAAADVTASITPGAGETTAATVDIGGSSQDVIIDSNGNMTAADDGAQLYLEGGVLTKNNATAGTEATATNVAAAVATTAGDSITVGDTAFTGDGTNIDVTGATISAEGLQNLADGNAYSVTLDSTQYDVDAAGEVTDNAGGDVQYLSADGELTADDVTTTTYFAQENGKVTDNTGAQVYKDADGELSMEAVTEKERSSLSDLDSALSDVDALRSDLGAIQNRMESSIENLSTTETNLSAARSRIEDADYAVEVANMTRAQILQQAGTSVLAQANQIPQNVLSLLG
ncbi:flagellin [Vreelandella subterranea]|uniref:Flagellin n=1 Tax=Vreelandella subterranea TaxID=416874 RepID=A0A1H9P171_9GAMM|nr:flagellin [Halomonas subterranea]SER41871.1 flagellin [Halomonas subterranea]